jgi:hypothetical protein
MRLLLQFGTFLFVLSTILVPIAEFFDRWDAPGISNDTEFGFFAVVLVLCLVLLVSRLVAAFGHRIQLVAVPRVLEPDRPLAVEADDVFAILRPPTNLVPLRI